MKKYDLVALDWESGALMYSRWSHSPAFWPFLTSASLGCFLFHHFSVQPIYVANCPQQRTPSCYVVYSDPHSWSPILLWAPTPPSKWKLRPTRGNKNNIIMGTICHLSSTYGKVNLEIGLNVAWNCSGLCCRHSQIHTKLEGTLWNIDGDSVLSQKWLLKCC